jgi:predicted SAM-dependent methyltransferase
MLKRVARRIKRFFDFSRDAAIVGRTQLQRRIVPAFVSQREMVRKLSTIPYWEDKINFTKTFDYSDVQGIWVQPADVSEVRTLSTISAPECHKVNYGCGGNILDGWLNLDLYESEAQGYKRVNLLEKHPFHDNSVFFGFSEDMLEHLNQAESIFFLSEIYRTLAQNGVMRLSFPGLEGVLQKHYTPTTEKRVREGELEAYSFWDHIHFYSRDELRTVAKHLGFRDVKFFEFGKSDHSVLSNMDTREHQIGLNTHAELTK